MTACNPGDVILVRFPFTDLAASKKRPALVLSPPEYSAMHGDLVVLALTSQPQSSDALRLDGWKDAGLPKPTWLKPIVATLSSRVVDRRIGILAECDIPRATAALRLAISQRFLAG